MPRLDPKSGLAFSQFRRRLMPLHVRISKGVKAQSLAQVHSGPFAFVQLPRMCAIVFSILGGSLVIWVDAVVLDFNKIVKFADKPVEDFRILFDLDPHAEFVHFLAFFKGHLLGL